MKQVLIILTLAIATLLSCNIETKEKTNTNVQEEVQQEQALAFENYVTSLDQITFPLKHYSLGQLPDISKKYGKKGFEKFRHTWTSQPLGILYKNKQTIGIIDCSIGDWGLVPFLTTYDLNGKKIDSTGFYEKSGHDMGYEAIEYVTFNEDRTISVVDTVKRWDINEDESDIVEGSMKMTTGRTEYLILENGKIEKK